MEIVRESLVSCVNHFGWLHFAAYRFQHSLYHQKHAFYFHNVEKWVEKLWVSVEPRVDLKSWLTLIRED